MQNRIQQLIGLIAVAMLSTMIVSASTSEKSYSQRQLTINGAGATFPFPLIDTWRVAYQKVHPDVNINFQSIGSGEGLREFAAWTKVSLLNSPGPTTYPIATFTYLLLPKDLSTNP